MGVLFWYWWVDVLVVQCDGVYIVVGLQVSDVLKVKYCGIFLNDEVLVLINWIYEKFGGYNVMFYCYVFEFLLCLKVNFLWFVMWNNVFVDDDLQNMYLVYEMGIVMSILYYEFMMWVDKEWNCYGSGFWEYLINLDKFYEFWVEGVKCYKDKDVIFIMGM